MARSGGRPPADEADAADASRRHRAARAVSAPVRAVGKVLPRTTRGAAGEQPDGDQSSAIVDCGLYVDGARQPGFGSYDQALRRAREAGGDAFVWVGLHEPTFSEFAGVAEEFGLHPLAVEDAVHAHQRPKLERYGDTSFIVFKTVRYVAHEELTGSSEVIETGEIMLFVGTHFLVSVRHGDACRLSGVRADLEHASELLRHGPWAVTYAIADRIVDEYLSVSDEVEVDIDEVEAGVFSPREQSDVLRLYQLKRELLEFRRAVVPLARPLGALTTSGIPSVPPIPPEVRSYFRDVEDHLQRVTEQVAGFDDLLTTILEANLAQIGVQQNNDMRKISAWVAIAAVPTMIAGIYGMNFDNMPELHWKYSYFAVLALMLTICVGLYRAFRRSGWL